MLKKRAKSGPGEINAGSMADIAFLLLIFFLVTTTMDTDVGILRLLPPMVETPPDPDVINKRNVYEVLVNDADQLLVEGEPMDIKELRAGAKEFMTNPANLDNLPAKTKVSAAFCREQLNLNKGWMAAATDTSKARFEEGVKKWEGKLKAIELLGEYSELPNDALISLQTGSKTSYNMYVQVQNELESGIRELRDELSKEKFGRKFTELDEKVDEDQDRIKAIRLVFPQRISEAEPVDLTKKN
jgi:biopolymer transport protein ExbD